MQLCSSALVGAILRAPYVLARRPWSAAAVCRYPVATNRVLIPRGSASIRDVSWSTGASRNTVRRYLRSGDDASSRIPTGTAHFRWLRHVLGFPNGGIPFGISKIVVRSRVARSIGAPSESVEDVRCNKEVCLHDLRPFFMFFYRVKVLLRKPDKQAHGKRGRVLRNLQNPSPNTEEMSA